MIEITFSSVQAELRAFAVARGWTEVHTPQNLALALASEVGELCHVLRWGAEGVEATDVVDELADIGIFLAYMCSVYAVDLAEVMYSKLLVNDRRFPVE